MRLVGKPLMMAALLAMGVPAAAQYDGHDGEDFLKALREAQGTKALDLATAKGSTVVNYRGINGDTPLTIVTRMRNSQWIGFLLANGANPGAGDQDGDTPLILAARSGYSEGVARLLQGRAPVDNANRRGETALIAAVQARQPMIVRMLLRAGANPDKRDHAAGYSAREYAKRDSRMPELLRLIETTASVRSVTGPVKP